MTFCLNNFPQKLTPDADDDEQVETLPLLGPVSKNNLTTNRRRRATIAICRKILFETGT